MEILPGVSEALHTDFVHEKRHMDFFLETPPPPPPLRNVTHFFDSAEAPEAMLILQALRLSVVHKGIKVNLGQGQDLIMSIKIYLKKGYSP